MNDIESAAIEAAARAMAEADGHNPNQTVSLGVPYQVLHHRCVFASATKLPVWSLYCDLARAALISADASFLVNGSATGQVIRPMGTEVQ